MCADELMTLSNILRKAAMTFQENDELKREKSSLERRLREDKILKENSSLKDEVNRLRLGHKELKEKAGNEKHRADMLDIALQRKNLEMDVSSKKQAKIMIIQDLKKHIKLIGPFYKQDEDLCLKLIDLVHQAFQN